MEQLVIQAILKGAIQKPEELLPFLWHVLPLKTVVEIGCDAGGMLWLWEQLGVNAIGVDLPGAAFSSGEGLRYGNVIIGDSHKPEIRIQVTKWLDGAKADLIFIDGDHTYEGVKQDFEIYSPFAQMVAFHDIVPHEGLPEVGVHRLWSELGGKTAFIKPGSKDGGIGLLKRSPKGWS